VGELLVLTAIAWAAARGIETTIDEVKGRTTTRHKAAVAKTAMSGTAKDPKAVKDGGKTRTEPVGVPATFGRKAATVTARTVAGGATWGRDALSAYRQAIGDAYRVEADKVRRRRAEKAVARTRAKSAPGVPAHGGAVSGPNPAAVPPPPPYPPAVGTADADRASAVPRLQVLPGGADTTPDTGKDLMTILETGEVTSLAALTRYLRAVSSVSQVNADAAQIIADKDTKLVGRLDAINAQLTEIGVDTDTVGEIARLQELVEVQAATARVCAARSMEASEAAVVASAGAQMRHGSIAEAVADADLDAPAEAAYYTEGK
jgi:hypothetical protein